MGYDFPNTPTTGQAFGNYVWDGEKWQLPGNAYANRATIYAAPFDALAYNGMQINGSMEVSQERGTTATSIFSYIVDGWQLSTLGTMVVSAAQANTVLVAGIPSFINVGVGTSQPSLGAGHLAVVLQAIEGYRISRLNWGGASNAQPITVGFWSIHSLPGTYSGVVQNGASDRSYAFTYTQNAGDTPEYKTVTIPGDTAGVWVRGNTAGMKIVFAMACGTTYTAPSANTWLAGTYYAAPGQVNAVASTANSFRITGVVVLPGIEAPSAARSPLIMRPYDQELVTCKRYWELTEVSLIGYQAGGTSITSNVNFATKRSVPTCSLLSFGANSNAVSAAVYDPKLSSCMFGVNAVATGIVSIRDVQIVITARL